jgi:hypothetical protein
MGVVSEFWEHFDADAGPFGQTMRRFLDFAGVQFDKHMRVLERDRGKALRDIAGDAVRHRRRDAASPRTIGRPGSLFATGFPMRRGKAGVLKPRFRHGGFRPAMAAVSHPGPAALRDPGAAPVRRGS